jgi:hypothetical protein
VVPSFRSQTRYGTGTVSSPPFGLMDIIQCWIADALVCVKDSPYSVHNVEPPHLAVQECIDHDFIGGV